MIPLPTIVALYTVLALDRRCPLTLSSNPSETPSTHLHPFALVLLPFFSPFVVILNKSHPPLRQEQRQDVPPSHLRYQLCPPEPVHISLQPMTSPPSPFVKAVFEEPCDPPSWEETHVVRRRSSAASSNSGSTSQDVRFLI